MNPPNIRHRFFISLLLLSTIRFNALNAHASLFTYRLSTQNKWIMNLCSRKNWYQNPMIGRTKLNGLTDDGSIPACVLCLHALTTACACIHTWQWWPNVHSIRPELIVPTDKHEQWKNNKQLFMSDHLFWHCNQMGESNKKCIMWVPPSTCDCVRACEQWAPQCTVSIDCSCTSRGSSFFSDFSVHQKIIFSNQKSISVPTERQAHRSPSTDSERQQRPTTKKTTPRCDASHTIRCAIHYRKPLHRLMCAEHSVRQKHQPPDTLATHISPIDMGIIT